MKTQPKIVISGATGFLGKFIIDALAAKGYSLCILSRNSEKAEEKTLGTEHEYVRWDGDESEELKAAIEGSRAVIHLAGANIAGKRWSDSYKREIIESRSVGPVRLQTLLLHP